MSPVDTNQMKTAQEWMLSLEDVEPASWTVCRITEKEIRAIQADALRHASTLARELNDGHDWPISRLLEEEANKLERRG